MAKSALTLHVSGDNVLASGRVVELAKPQLAPLQRLGRMLRGGLTFKAQLARQPRNAGCKAPVKGKAGAWSNRSGQPQQYALYRRSVTFS